MLIDPQLARERFNRDVQPLRENPETYAALGIHVLRVDYPVLEVALQWRPRERELILHVEVEDYDYLPIRGWWVDAQGKPLRSGMQQLPLGMGFQTEGGHPYGQQQAWLCFRGWREYHDHPGHQDMSWAFLRKKKEYRLPGILVQLHDLLNRGGIQAA